VLVLGHRRPALDLDQAEVALGGRMQGRVERQPGLA
jgi:hypothetical protein